MSDPEALAWAWSILEEQPPSPGEGYRPPSRVRKRAYEGLMLRAENVEDGKSRPGGTEVGVARAIQLFYADEIPLRAVKRMRSYFARHAVDSEGEGWGEDSPGWVAWLLWGGNEGQRWVDGLDV